MASHFIIIDGTTASVGPASGLTYKGAWNANTNTPTLADGDGAVGDFYKVSVAGTQDLGSGSVTYAVGDDVVYNGTIWQKFTLDGKVSKAGDTMTGPLNIEGSTDAVQLEVKAHSTQTANLIEVLANDDSVIASISTTGLGTFAGGIVSAGDINPTSSDTQSIGAGNRWFRTSTKELHTQDIVRNPNADLTIGVIDDYYETYNIKFNTGNAVERMSIAGNGNVHINNNLAVDGHIDSGSHSITGTSDAVQLTVKSNAVQSTNLQEWQGSDSTVLASVDKDGNVTATNLSGTNTGDMTLGAVGASPAAEGASISGQVLTLQPADDTHPGLLTTGQQTLAGEKDFLGEIYSPNQPNTYEKDQATDLGALTWSAGVAPSGTIVKKYRAVQIGDWVEMWFKITASVAGTAVTAVSFPLPASTPAGVSKPGADVGTHYMWATGAGAGPVSTAITVGMGSISAGGAPTSPGLCVLTTDGSGNFVININSTAVAGDFVMGHITYMSG